MSETTAQNRVFVYEPHLVSNLAELLHFEKAVPYVCFRNKCLLKRQTDCVVCRIYKFSLCVHSMELQGIAQSYQKC